MQTLKERQVTSTILIPIFEKCLDYLQSWLNIDIKLVWYEEDDQFDLVVLSLRYGCPSRWKFPCRQLERHNGALRGFK